MEETSIRIPEDFNPYLAADALKGITESIYWFITEGPGCEQPMPPGARASLVGLSWTAARLARELNAYFHKASEAGLEFPRHGDDESIRESDAPYTVN